MFGIFHRFTWVGVALTLGLPPAWSQEVSSLPPAVQRTYAVADLVVPISMDTTAPAPKEPATKEKDLIDIITRHVAPGTWTDRGPGIISYHPLTMSLVVTHAPAAQADIQKLLSRLRREMDKEVAVEMRFAWVSESMIEPLALELSKLHPEQARPPMEERLPSTWPWRSLRLDDKQTRWLLETVQGDRRANIVQSPKMTLFNGQRAMISVLENQIFVTGYESRRDGTRDTVVPKTTVVPVGHQHMLQPVIEDDGKTVRVALKLSHTSLTGPTRVFPVTEAPQEGRKDVAQRYVQQPAVSTQAMEITFKVPDQHTQLLYVGSMQEESRVEYGSPVLSKVPYLSRLYRNVGYGRETRHMLVLVTPRIIVNEETSAQR